MTHETRPPADDQPPTRDDDFADASMSDASMSEALASDELLSDELLGGALVWLEAEADVEAVERELATQAHPPLPAHLVLASKAAFARSVLVSAPVETAQAAGPRAEPEGVFPDVARSAAGAPTSAGRGAWLRVAALLVMLLGGAAFLAIQGGLLEGPGGASDAHAGFHLHSVSRLQVAVGEPTTIDPVASQDLHAEPGVRFAPVDIDVRAIQSGQRLAVPANDLYVLALDPAGGRAHTGAYDQARLVLPAGSVLRRQRARDARQAAWALDAGSLVAELRARRSTAAQAGLRIDLGAAGQVELLRGAVHVTHEHVTHDDSTHDAATAASIVLSLGEQTHVHWFAPRAGETGQTVLGPRRVRLHTVDGTLRMDDAGAPDNALRALQDRVGGPLRSRGEAAWIRAQAWRVRAGAAHRRDGRLIVQGGGHATVSFMPMPAQGDYRAMRIALRAPAGTQVRVAGGTPVVLDRDTRAYEPASQTLDLPLPAGWWQDLNGDELAIEIHVPQDPAAGPTPTEPGASDFVASFEGVAFHTGSVGNGNG